MKTDITTQEKHLIVTKINNILTNIFGEKVHYVCRRISETKKTTDNLPAIGFHTEQNFDENSFLNFLMRNMRTQQLIHPNYFSFYVKHESSKEMVHTFKIEISPINSEIAEEYEFPAFTKDA